MSQSMALSRRGFLKVGTGLGGSLIIGLHVPDIGRPSSAATPSSATFQPNAFVRIGTDDVVTVIIHKSEMGQGIYTSLAMLVAEELEADWSKIRVEAAPVAPVYHHPAVGIQMIGGSSSVWSSWEPLRHAGAMARAMLIAAAAETWRVDPASCRVENAIVIHTASQQRLSFGQLAQRASRLPPPSTVALKHPKAMMIIGKAMKRLDTPAKTTGRAMFGIDVQVTGMLTAVIARPPVFGARVKNVIANQARAIPGVKAVVPIDSGVAVVADGFWPAKQGRDMLEISWDEGPLATLDTLGQRQQYAELAKQPGVVARKDGDAAAALSRAVTTLEAIYEVPYLAHATMEPLNCVAGVRPDGCDVWTGTQVQTVDHDAAAQITKLKPEQIRVHTMLLGGGFGRRAVPDSHFVREAVQLSKVMAAPVKVIWTREDDIRGGWYRPMWYDRITAGLDASGNPIAWTHTIVG